MIDSEVDKESFWSLLVAQYSFTLQELAIKDWSTHDTNIAITRDFPRDFSKYACVYVTSRIIIVHLWLNKVSILYVDYVVSMQ